MLSVSPKNDKNFLQFKIIVQNMMIQALK